MAERNHEDNKDLQPKPSDKPRGGELDAAGKSLSEALRVSFIILKVIMVILVIAFLASGFKTVGSDEEALLLRFGRIKPVGEERVFGPGLHWVFPYPIDEIIKIPVAKKVNLPINSFWYYQKPSELLSENPTPPSRIQPVLYPTRDGYCITRSEKQAQAVIGSTGSDYNIVHCKWQLTYQINDPEEFFRNVYFEDVKPGDIYFDVITNSITPLLQSIVEDAVVTAMVNYSIDEALSSQDRIPKHVARLVQQKLDKIESGIKVVSMQLTDITWPRQVNKAFLDSIKARQESQKTISEAKGYAENTLSETAGPRAEQLHATLTDKNMAEQDKEALWAHLAGTAQEKIAQARAYKTKVIEAAKANADYLERILPEYRKRPELVVQEIYLDAIEYVLNNADEKFVIQRTEGTKDHEIRILINRDPTLKPKSKIEK